MTAEARGLPAARKAELQAAGLKVGAAALVLAGLFALYAHEVKVEQQVTDLLAGTRIAGGRAGGARAELNKDTPRGWLAAEDALQRALDLQPSNPYAVAANADVEVLLASAGFADRAQRADDAVARAEGRNEALPERYEARALQLIAQNMAGEAETYLLALLQKYGSVPRLIDALGRAQRASGKLFEARVSFRKAQDTDWRAARYIADYAQALLEDGSPLEAAQAFDRALQANSDHTRSQIGKARALAALSQLGRGGGDLKTARALCDAVLAKPDRELPQRLKAQALAARAEARLAEGDAASAAKDAEAAAQADARSAAALRAQALAAAARKSPGAAAAFTAAVAADPYDASTYFWPRPAIRQRPRSCWARTPPPSRAPPAITSRSRKCSRAGRRGGTRRLSCERRKSSSPPMRSSTSRRAGSRRRRGIPRPPPPPTSAPRSCATTSPKCTGRWAGSTSKAATSIAPCTSSTRRWRDTRRRALRRRRWSRSTATW
jgi:hypothetical protein